MKNTVHLIGSAHLDPVWLWRWQEGYAEIKATFRSALDRIAEFPGFIFTSACAAYYKWVEDNDPDMFQEIRQRVGEGRWYIAGGMWIQPDCNVPSGESFARHLLYSQRYFMEKFGKCAEVGYNVDSFGHNGSLPKILLAAGIDSYVMMRPSPKENPDIPQGAFWWESDDGSRVLAFRIREPYNCTFADPEQLGLYLADSDRLGIPVMCFYGVGNHGGGPTIKTLQYIEERQAQPGGDRLLLSSPGAYFDQIRAYPLPTWKSDMQWHASGCYSAMSEIKMNNRRAENRLVQAEKFASLANRLASYQMPGEWMDKAWQGVLFNQFHDIMGGCSIPEAYEDARELHGQALSIAAEVSNAAVQSISWKINTVKGNSRRSKEGDWSFWGLDGLGTPVVVFNPLSWKRKIPVRLTRPVKRVTDDQGRDIPVQIIRASRTNNKDKWDSLFAASVPAMGYAVYWAFLEGEGGKQEFTCLSAQDTTIENKFLKLTIDPSTGYIGSLYDKQNDREVFSGPAGVPLVIDVEHCDTWAHNVFSFRDICGQFENAEVTILETGPVRVKIRAKSYYGGSTLIQDYMLYEHSREVQAQVWLEWREHFKMLKLSFPINAENDTASYDIPYGVITRPAKGTEEPGQMWFDASGGGYGLSILNDGKYSFDTLDHDMHMTIANGAMYADHYAGDNRDGLCEFLDQGIQRFRYALYPHTGGWDIKTVKAAYELNTEVTHVTETYHAGGLPREYEGIRISAENVIVTAFKPAYEGDGHILRLCEYEGKDTVCRITLPALNRDFSVRIGRHGIKTIRVPYDEGSEISECDLREI